MTTSQSSNMQRVPSGTPPLCRSASGRSTRRKEEESKGGGGGGGGSRDILMSSLVPINSLTTHASCSAQACGKVTQKREALEKEMTSAAADNAAIQTGNNRFLLLVYSLINEQQLKKRRRSPDWCSVPLAESLHGEFV